MPQTRTLIGGDFDLTAGRPPLTNLVIVKHHPSHRPITSNREFFESVLSASGIGEANRAPRKLNFSKRQYSLAMVAVLLLLLGSYFSFIGLKSSPLLPKTSLNKISADLGSLSFGQSTSSVPVAIKPTANDIASYSVPPDDPRYIFIPKLNVDARVLNVGLTKDGAINTPSNVYDAAWYNGSSKPGDAGATVIDGHISSWTTNGVFYGLNKLSPGDTITIERGDGTKFNYQVVKTVVYQSNNVDMQSVMSPVVAGKNGLNLISCAGDVISGTNEFNERIVVYSEQV